MLSGNTWERVEKIFNEALARPEAERTSFVESCCAKDPAARVEVLKLLDAQARMGAFMESSALDFRGHTFGTYRAVDEIGRGGMSVVYRGERADGDFEKRVAIKVVLAQTGTAPETRILASLEHPHIARLLDGGLTPLGFRYLVMEFVEGVPCTKYAVGLNLAQKLRLFLQICAGVQYAHQSLVVHRDLKPDNILVTSSGEVKLLDFGIAKMLTPTGEQTSGARAYTLDYASPEQIIGHPSSTANDVYSLGVLLCELVSGHLPQKLSDLPLDEVLRLIQQDEPPSLPVEGELGLIVRKAMRREPAQRYDSAGALARDVERYLTGQPIEARAPTWRYRASKFIGRHRYGVAAATAAALALAITSGYAWRQATLADLRFNQVRTLSRSVMFDLHDMVAPLAGSLPARQMIVDRSLTYLDALATAPGASDDVLLDAARGFLRLAEIQGKDVESASVGKSAEALKSAQRAVETARRVRARSPRLPAARETMLDALVVLSSAYTNVDKGKEAFTAAQEAATLAEAWLAAEPDNIGAKRKAAQAAGNMADAYSERNAWPDALKAAARAVALCEQVFASRPDDLEARLKLVGAYNRLSSDYFRSGNRTEAARINDIGLPHSKQLYASEPKKYRAYYASDIGVRAAIESAEKRFDRSVEMYREQLRLRREMEAENPKDFVTAVRVAATLDRLSFQLRQAGRIREAVQAGEESLAKLRRLRALDPTNAYANSELIYSLVDLGLALKENKQGARACGYFQEAVTALKGPLSHSNLGYTKYGKLAQDQAAACGKP